MSVKREEPQAFHWLSTLTVQASSCPFFPLHLCLFSTLHRGPSQQVDIKPAHTDIAYGGKHTQWGSGTTAKQTLNWSETTGQICRMPCGICSYVQFTQFSVDEGKETEEEASSYFRVLGCNKRWFVIGPHIRTNDRHLLERFWHCGWADRSDPEPRQGCFPARLRDESGCINTQTPVMASQIPWYFLLGLRAYKGPERERERDGTTGHSPLYQQTAFKTHTKPVSGRP